MALAAQNSQTSRHSYTARPSRDYLLEDDYGPPFLAEAVRLNAIENIRSYQSLTLRRVSDENDSDPAEGKDAPPPFPSPPPVRPLWLTWY